jgi:hypothetical protein
MVRNKALHVHFFFYSFYRTGGIGLLVNDVFMNIFIIFVVVSGTSLFPAIIRGVVNLLKLIVP